MLSRIVFIATLNSSLFLSCLIAQQPFYPRPNINNEIVFNRTMPAALLNKLNYSNLNHKNSYPSEVINYSNLINKYNINIPINENKGGFDVNGKTNINNINTNTNQVNFHLTRDINTCTPGSFPNSDNRYDFVSQYKMINNIVYFGADDGLHGMELWRSDGTSEGTYIIKDINPGLSGSGITSIIVQKNKLFFSAYTNSDGWQPWVSDGTAEGTKEITQINNSIAHNFSEGFINVNNKVFFTTNSDFGSALFITDGTTSGTKLIYDFNASDLYAGYITQPVAAHGLLFFTAWTPSNGRELWRSDGTSQGTFMVKDVGPDQSDYFSPLQLTEYNDQLYYSGDDGTGRRLWFSDGTANGTQPVMNLGNVFIQNDNTNYNTRMPFAVMNDILYFSGYTFSNGNGLYSYDASKQNSITLIKDITPSTDIAFIDAPELRAINNTLFFKVISSIGGYHDELWTSKGSFNNTQPIKIFEPGKATFNYFNVDNKLYFDTYDPSIGTEPWTSDGTSLGTSLLKDIFNGSQSSNAFFFTPFKNKVLFNAGDGKVGTELWITDGKEENTKTVKDINSSTTNNSDAGLFIKGIGSLGNYAIFGAFEPLKGGELYRSDGTAEGTKLINNIAPEDQWSYPNSFLNKNGVVYFIGDNSIGTSIYKSDGTKQGLQKVVYNIDRSIYYVEGFNVTDNGLPFYILVNRYTGNYELWRSDGTQNGTYSLSPNLFLNYGDYIVTIGNTAYFTADDGIHGPHIWKSDGTIAGTKMAENLNPYQYGSYPYSLFAFNNELYFSAYDGNGFFYSFWKTNGTEVGTIKLKDITTAYWGYYDNYFNHYYSQYFCASGNTLFLNATDYSSNYYQGAELWKTNGTPQGTVLVKDINPFYGSNPSNLVDVNGTLFFKADDGTYGTELWTSDGTSDGTKMVKDITPGYSSSNLDNFVSAGGKLYFVKDDGWFSTLWWADCNGNANAVIDPGLNDLHNIQALTAAGNKLFFNAYTTKFGTELYAGETGLEASFTSNNLSGKNKKTVENNSSFEARLYPNPTTGPLSLRISGASEEIAITVSTSNGQVIWSKKVINTTSINIPTEKFVAGAYTLTIKSGSNLKSLKFVKQ